MAGHFFASRAKTELWLRGLSVGGAVLLLAMAARGQEELFGFDRAGNLLIETTEPQALPQILGRLQTQVIVPGEAASFSVLVADATGVTYQWLFNGTAMASGTTDALLLTNVSANDEGLYSVVVANGSGSVTSAPAALYIDSRGCGMPDSWQLAHFGNLTQNPTGDFDGDGVSNLQEFLDGTDPAKAASALYRIALFNDGGAVVAVPNQPAYSNGQVVALTATGSDAFPFHAWTGDVVTRSESISLVMTNNKSLYAHFSPIGFLWTNVAGGDWSVATDWTPNLAPGSNDSVAIPASVSTVTLNSNVDLTDFTLGGSQGDSPIFAGGGTVTLHGALLWTSGTMSGSGHTIIAPGGTVNFANTVPILLLGRTLENAGTTVWTGAGRIDVGAVITNDAGGLFVMRQANSMVFGGGSASRFDNAGTFVTAPGAGTTAFGGVGFNNYGTVEIQGGTLSLSGGGTDAGSISVPAGATLVFAGGIYTSSGTPSITGAGNLTMSSGTATLAGTVNVTGSNVFSGCSVDFTGNYIYTNGPMIISAGAASFDGASIVSPSLLTLSGGALGGAVTVTVGSAMTWTGGSMTGTGRTIIPPGVTLNIGSGNVLFLADRTLDNLGTTVWSGDAIHMTSGVVTNEAGALFEAQGPGSMSYAGGSPRFDNAGTFHTSAGTGTTAFAGVSFNNYGDAQIQDGTLQLTGGGLNNGTVEVAAGATVSLGGVAFVTAPASSITGAGNFTVSGDSATLSGLVNVSGTNTFSVGTTELNGNYICTNNAMIISAGAANFDGTSLVSPSRLTLSGGVLGGAVTVTVGGAMIWTGGSMTGSGRTIIPAGVTLNMGGGNELVIADRTLDNLGTAVWSGGTIDMNSGVVTNAAGALFEAQGPGSISFGGGSPRFDNAGTFVKSAGTGTTAFAGVSFNNYHNTQIQGGTLQLNGGGLNHGTMEVPAGATLNLGGVAFVTAPASSITGAGNFTVSADSATLSGLVNVSGTNTFSTGTTELNGNYICTNNTMMISGGTANFDGTGPVSPSVLNLSGGVLGGAGIVTVGSAMTWTGGSMTGTGRTIIPAGATLNIGSGNFLAITSRTLDNLGTAVWSGGRIDMNSDVVTNAAGALFEARGPGSISFGGGTPRFDNAGTFRKSVSPGTTTIGGSVLFTNYGTVDIQSGVLAANGGYASSSNAVLNCALAGTTAGTNYGQLQITGPVTLNGTLTVGLANGYVPATGDSFTVLTAGTRNGTFASFYYPSNAVTMQLSNTPNSVIVRVTAVAAAPHLPLLLSPVLSGTNVLLTWTAVSNITYRLEFNPDLTSSNWTALPGDVLGLTNTASKEDIVTPSNRFYRVRVFP